MKLYMFWTVPLSNIRSFSLYTQQWYMSSQFADSLQAGSGWNILILLASYSQTDMMYTIAVCKGKGKAIPLQAWTDPEGSRRLRLPDFKTNVP
jgi:hypothetical protein